MEASAEPPEIKRTGRNWLDTLLGVSAIVVSLTSLYLAYNSNDAMQRLVHASSWPFVQLGSGNTSDDGRFEMAFGLENVGTGPARIHSFEILVDGQQLPSGGHRLTNMLRACCNAEFEAALDANGGDIAAIYGAEVSSPVAHRFLATNDDITAVRWPRTEANRTLWTALDTARQSGRITMSSCYCSAFDECWIASSNTFTPEEVDTCTPEAPGSNAR